MHQFPPSGWSRFPNKDLGARHHKCRVGVPLADQPGLGHNRWHPDIPPIDELLPGEEVILEMPGHDDYQFKDTDDVRDVLAFDHTRAHPMAGPIAVKGAEPGDLLVVDILEVESLSGVGHSAITPRHSGLLRDMFPDAFKSVWYIRGSIAESRHIPGVRIPGIPHPGVIGVAPSRELLEKWHRRESPLYAERKALPPYPPTAVLGCLDPTRRARVALEAARTYAPRENGGNMNIKYLSRGSRIFFPVFVNGALLSIGDCHFAEGDGEITANAIEMDAAVRVRVNIIKDGVRQCGVTSPTFVPGRLEPRFTNYISFTGFSFQDEQQYYLDATFAARNAALNAIDYLQRLGYTGPQAYTLLSVAPIEMHISSIVDIPNACVTLFLPLEIFVSN